MHHITTATSQHTHAHIYTAKLHKKIGNSVLLVEANSVFTMSSFCSHGGHRHTMRGAQVEAVGRVNRAVRARTGEITPDPSIGPFSLPKLVVILFFE